MYKIAIGAFCLCLAGCASVPSGPVSAECAAKANAAARAAYDSVPPLTGVWAYLPWEQSANDSGRHVLGARAHAATLANCGGNQ